MISTRRGRAILLVGWVALLVGAIGVLHVIGRGPLAAPPVTRPSALATWLDERSSAALAFGAVRLATMGLAWYLLATTLAGLLARIAGSTRWSEAADFISPRLVRRLLQGAAGMTVAATVTSTQAVAWAAPVAPPTAPSPVPIMRRLPAGPPSTSTSASTLAPPPVGAPPVSAPLAPVPTGSPPSRTWVVRSGDNLWSVAEATLARAWGRSPSDAEVDDYWRRLIAANQARLAHRDDPDLVFPGQVFQLPPTPG